MFDTDKNYLKELTHFLHDVKWMFCALNTHYIIEDIMIENRSFIESLTHLQALNLPELQKPQSDHPECLRKFIEQVNRFKIPFDVITTESNKSAPIKKMSRKKQYEIENASQVIHSVCRAEVKQLVDFGSGLGYLGHYLFDKYGYSVVGLDSSNDRVEKARERQEKFHPTSLTNVRHLQHFINFDSAQFILKKFDDDARPLAIFGLHGCGDLTITAIKLFLEMERVTKLIFMPCCYHKMSAKVPQSDDFNYFPLSDELKAIVGKFPTFLNRPFLRLAGQQSPAKWKEMTADEHWLHGKNMFERALAEAMLAEDETMKRISNVSFPENRVTMDDIVLKYQLMEKSSGRFKEWSEAHQRRFQQLREKYPDGEEMSENLFCLQTTLQNNCENLVLMDRVRYIQEEAKRRNLKLKISVKKLQNDKLSPRCLILIVEKF